MTAYEQLKIMMDATNYLVKDEVFEKTFLRAIESHNDWVRKQGKPELVIPRSETLKNVNTVKDVKKILKQIETVREKEYKLKLKEKAKQKKAKEKEQVKSKKTRQKLSEEEKKERRKIAAAKRLKKSKLKQRLTKGFKSHFKEKTGFSITNKQADVIGQIFQVLEYEGYLTRTGGNISSSEVIEYGNYIYKNENIHGSNLKETKENATNYLNSLLGLIRSSEKTKELQIKLNQEFKLPGLVDPLVEFKKKKVKEEDFIDSETIFNT